MALTSPALTLAVPALFGNIKPALDLLKRLGPTDFSAEAPNMNIAPGATIKVPISSIAAATAFNASTNNYLTGGNTDWASVTAAHYLQGFDISGVNVDQGVDQKKMEQLFTKRAGTGIAYAIQNAVAAAIDGVTVSTAVKIPGLSTVTLADYMGLCAAKPWFTGSMSALVVNGPEYAKIRALCAASNIVGDDVTLAKCLGFKDLILVPGMTNRLAIVPDGAFGSIGRVPALIAKYAESGVEIDPDTGLAVGIVIADDQATNKRVANADEWFGAYVVASNAAATTAGVIKVGTAA